MIVQKIECQFGTTICWEHGIGFGRSGGCGVTHAHMHVLPLPIDSILKLNNILKERLVVANPIIGLKAISMVAGLEDSYLYWELSAQQESYIELSENISSQLMRRIIAEIHGMVQWDWRELSYWDVFKSTLEAFV